MEVQFRKVSVKGVEFEYTKVSEQSYVSVASISNRLDVDSSLFRNILRRKEPYSSLCQTFEQRDSKNRLQEQICVPLALLSGLFEKAFLTKTVKSSPELREKMEFMMTLFILLTDKIFAEHVEMSADLMAIMEAQATQREVFNKRAELSHKMRESKKLIGSYYAKYEDKLNGQLQLGD